MLCGFILIYYLVKVIGCMRKYLITHESVIIDLKKGVKSSTSGDSVGK